MIFRQPILFSVIVLSISGCGGGGPEPVAVTEKQMTTANAQNARENVRGLVQTVKDMQKTGDDLESFREELMPTFANYAANPNDQYHAIYKQMRNAWEDIGGDNTAEALKELEAAYKELP